MIKRILNFIIITIVACCLICCFSKSVPDWKHSGFNYLEKFKHSFLSGDDERATLYYEKAIAEIKKSGKLDTLAKVFLTKCAVHVAALEQGKCSEFLQIRDLIQDKEIDNYFNFITGNFESVDGQLLPKDYQTFFKAFTKHSRAAINDAIGNIQSPLCRIIAVGLSIKQGQSDESMISMAINTASDQGWKKVLLRYLEAMKTLHEQNGDTDRAEKVQRRIDVMDINQ